MKTSLLFSYLFFLILGAQAQLDPVPQMQADFKDNAVPMKGAAAQYMMFGTYSSSGVKGSQFFYPGFQDGSVTTTNNEVLTGIYKFLFDKVRQEVFITSKSDKRTPPEVLQAEKRQIKSLTITTDRDHVFVPVHFYDPTNSNDFYEQLKKNDSGYTLLKLVKTTFVKMDYHNMEKVKQGEIYDEYVDKVTYYISYKSGKPQEISFKKKTAMSAFLPDKKLAAENYYNNHENDEVDEQFLVNLVDAVNK